MTKSKAKILNMVQVAFLAALIVVLQLVASMTAGILPVNITLTLLPIVIGGILLGPAYGAALGIIFGVIVLAVCMAGMDVGGAILFNANPFFCSLICLVKGAAAGFVPAFLFKKTKTFTAQSDARFFGITVLGAALAPIMNTGLFCLGMVLLYKDILISWAGGSDIITYMLLGLAGINFLIEFLINIILCPLMVRSLRNTKFFKQNL